MLIITGGAGFIGSNLVAVLESRGLGPLVVCDYFKDDEKWRNLSRRAPADIVHPDDLLTFLDTHKDDIQGIFHMGATSSTTELDAHLMVRNNFKTSLALLDWCTKTQTRFIYASSASTYGDGTHGFEDSEEAQDKFVPLNVYAWSKLLFDRCVHERKKSKRALPPQCVGLKFFNVYGPNEYHKESQRSVIHQVFETINLGNPAKLFKSLNPDYENGEQLRDFIWVDDCTDVMIWLYENPNVSGLYNVGTGKARSFNDLARAAFTALNQDPRIDYIDMPTGLSKRYQYFTEAKMDKLRQSGYPRDFTSLEDGVRLYIQNYLTKENPYR